MDKGAERALGIDQLREWYVAEFERIPAKQVAERAGISPETMYRFRDGIRPGPRIGRLLRAYYAERIKEEPAPPPRPAKVPEEKLRAFYVAWVERASVRTVALTVGVNKTTLYRFLRADAAHRPRAMALLRTGYHNEHARSRGEPQPQYMPLRHLRRALQEEIKADSVEGVAGRTGVSVHELESLLRGGYPVEVRRRRLDEYVRHRLGGRALLRLIVGTDDPHLTERAAVAVRRVLADANVPVPDGL